MGKGALPQPFSWLMKAYLNMWVLDSRCRMYLFSMAALEVLPISDANCGISHSFFCLTARRCSSWAALSDTPSSGTQRMLAWVMGSDRLFLSNHKCGMSWSSTKSSKRASTGSEMRMPVLSFISAASRYGMGWLSKCALTLSRCSTVMGVMVRDKSLSPRVYKRRNGRSRSMSKCNSPS
jgi:hypothetical protein